MAVAPPHFPQGDQIGVAAISRYDGELHIAEDSWKISTEPDARLRPALSNSTLPSRSARNRTAGIEFVNGPSGPQQQYLINPQPVYRWLGNNWAPRVRLSWQAAKDLWIRAGGALTTIPPNIWQDNSLTGAAPYVDLPAPHSAPRRAATYRDRITPADLPGVFTPAGVNILAPGNSKTVPANTIWDVDRFDQALAAPPPAI